VAGANSTLLPPFHSFFSQKKRPSQQVFTYQDGLALPFTPKEGGALPFFAGD